MNSDITAFIRDTLLDAGKIALKYFRHNIDRQVKADSSLVSEADMAIEEFIRARIAKVFTRHCIIGEEMGGEGVSGSPTWVIDPIDGTASFLSGRPMFGIMLGFMDGGLPLAGGVQQPFTGEIGRGAGGERATHNGVVVTTSQVTELSEAIIATTSTGLFTASELDTFSQLQVQTRQLVQGGDCYNYAMLASGFIDVVMESGLKMHDIQPLIPIIEGAGGVVTNWSGEPLGLSTSYQVLAAANPELHSKAVDLLSDDDDL